MTVPAFMNAARLELKNAPLHVVNMPVPKPGVGQVLIRVHACGVCGSDLHAAQADWTPTPIVMGHEYSGEVAALGPGVDQLRIGERVAPLSQITCGHCVWCHSGRSAQCPDFELVGFSRHYNGGYAEYVLASAHEVLRLPDEVSFAEAAALEPLAVGLDAVRHGGMRSGDQVLIIGGGPIGLCVATWARFCGGAHVVVSEPNTVRREKALQMGATHVIDPDSEGDVVSAFRERAGVLPNIIVEAVGRPGMISACIDLAPQRAMIIVVGLCQEVDSFEPRKAVFKSLSMTFPSGYSLTDYAFILQMLQQGRVRAAPIISHRISLDALPEMFAAMQSAPTDQIKVIVEPCPRERADIDEFRPIINVKGSK
jgi:2-desacetyl-2-hydroxyethyl bacteriochlorophyllide A dehydrogenase